MKRLELFPNGKWNLMVTEHLNSLDDTRSVVDWLESKNCEVVTVQSESGFSVFRKTGRNEGHLVSLTLIPFNGRIVYRSLPN